ncbi:hypothetical protein V5O48_002536 [Marasmius crinis-equi]|uniref:ceramidase n=1 Tax=Marasmius crinis-equi TaxID=585013 RepID=A0ABR3FW73_9AGAR
MPPQLRSQTRNASQPAIFTIPSSAQPPLYRIDLSLPPKERYREICSDYKIRMQEISPLYDEVLRFTPLPWLFKGVARLALRRVYSKEENEEIAGISKFTGIPKHLVIAFNTFLDLLSGCISGGTKVVDAAGSNSTSDTIVHFRGLDWEMDVLRSLTICVEYVRNGEVVARGVTYAGYIGVLTGVREGLSISLNYRPTPETSKRSLYLHYLRVILGKRPSNPSRLRTILLSSQPPPSSQQALEAELAKFPGSPCYLTFCTPENIFVFERGLDKPTVHTSSSFLAVTNHDKNMEEWDEEEWTTFMRTQFQKDDVVRDLVADSVERKKCICSLWEGRSAAGRLKVADVVNWLQTKPLLNECTHYSCVMNPASSGGGLLWVMTYDEPVYMDGDIIMDDSDSDVDDWGRTVTDGLGRIGIE